VVSSQAVILQALISGCTAFYFMPVVPAVCSVCSRLEQRSKLICMKYRWSGSLEQKREQTKLVTQTDPVILSEAMARIKVNMTNSISCK